MQLTMIDNIRDTVFGQLVRFLSRKKLLKFPDEMDSSLWKRFANGVTKSGEDAVPGSRNPGFVNDGGMDHLNYVVASNDGCEDIMNAGDNSSNEKVLKVYLVDWYGPGDEEVKLPRILRGLKLT